MPSCYGKSAAEYYRERYARMEAARRRLIAKGVIDGTTKMRVLLCRRGF